MDKYYYLVATLPTLQFGKEPGISVEKFLEEAEKSLNARDYQLLQSLAKLPIEKKSKEPRDVKRYEQYDVAIRQDIAGWRKAQKRDLDYKPEHLPVSALKEGTPLDVEIRLMEMRWRFLDEMERDHYFDLTTVMIYYLKLLLLQRYFSFDKDKGLNKFQKLYQEVTA